MSEGRARQGLLGGRVANPEALREANKQIKLLEQENEVLRRAAAYLSHANLPGN